MRKRCLLTLVVLTAAYPPAFGQTQDTGDDSDAETTPTAAAEKPEPMSLIPRLPDNSGDT